MENKDIIFEHIKDAAQRAESKEFPALDKVWARVEEKLDKKDDRKPVVLWRRIAIAASVLLFLTIGYQFFKSNIPTIKPENTVVTAKPKDSVTVDKTPIVKVDPPIQKSNAQPSPAIKTDIEVTPDKSIKRQQQVAIVDSVYFKAKRSKINVGNDIPKVRISNELVQPVYKAQIVSGTVSDAAGPLPGANVIVKGTNRGVQTDIDGKYSIDVKQGEQLVFSFVGMTDAIASVGQSKKLNIKMNDAGVMLESVVITGYAGKPLKKSLAQSTISNGADYGYSYSPGRVYRDGDKQKSENVPNPVPNATVIASLQGKVSGVELSTPSGGPGASTQIVLRGISTIKGSVSPIYVIDGVIATEKDFRDLKPEEIESVTVLKESDATAIYGSRASNGVIVLNKKNVAKTEPQSIEVSDEDYDPFIENPFESPVQSPLSTFSIDVDNASYTNIRRFINNGQTVPKDAVRVEEMVNFFKYKYPQPKDQHPFSINTDYSDCPWNPKHQLLRIGLQGKNIATENLPASNLVFLIDVSGSMSDDNKLPLLKQSMKVLINELREKDKVSIVVYAGAAGMVLPPTSGSDKAAIIAALDKLNAGGSTAGGAGIELAYKTAQENFIQGGNNRVILATDGDFNVGMSSNGDMETLIEQKRKSGVFLTCLGYGMGNYKDSKMEILADKGNGNYAYIDNIQEANRFLGKEFKGSMFAIAKDVKIQIEFNPKHVQAYRLIGYENRKLRPEDFKNDAIDAGELGSGHTVTALYEIVPTGVKSDFYEASPELKYTKTQSTGNFTDELATVNFRYKKPEGDKSIEMVKVIENKSIPLEETPEDFRFSAAVAWFGLKLRDSKFVGNKSSADIKRLAQKSKSDDPEGYKAEFVRLVEAVK